MWFSHRTAGPVTGNVSDWEWLTVTENAVSDKDRGENGVNLCPIVSDKEGIITR